MAYFRAAAGKNLPCSCHADGGIAVLHQSLAHATQRGEHPLCYYSRLLLAV